MRNLPTPENQQVDVRLLEKRVNILYDIVKEVLARLEELEGEEEEEEVYPHGWCGTGRPVRKELRK